MKKKWLIGVDIGGTAIKMAILNLEGTILVKWEIATNHKSNGKHIIQDISDSIFEKISNYDINKEEIKGIGIGAPGPVDFEKGTIIHTPNLSWPNHFPLKKLLEDRTNLPIMINNDANCAALGEMWKGAGNGEKDLVCITLGTGVGGGVITNGQIVQGRNGAAGEIGHITAIAHGGAVCNCGKTGCIETIASATGITRIAREYIKNEQNSKDVLSKIYKQMGAITAKDVFDTGRTGSKIAEKVILEITYYLGLVLANIANTLNPDKIVIGGGVSKAGEVLLNPLILQYKKFAYPPVSLSTTIVLAQLGNDAGVIGAAWLARNN
jgi:glucokinase